MIIRKPRWEGSCANCVCTLNSCRDLECMDEGLVSIILCLSIVIIRWAACMSCMIIKFSIGNVTRILFWDGVHIIKY